MAREGRGVAWVPRFYAHDDIASRALVPAGDEQFEIATEIRLIRSRAGQSESPESFWSTVLKQRREQNLQGLR